MFRGFSRSFKPRPSPATGVRPSRRMVLAGLAAAAVVSPAVAQEPPPVQAVLELFTSQGCSSCPPADKLFVKLAKEQGVLALTFPVTIWDYLGWKDTFAQSAFTARQKHYGLARGDRHIYTPQAVINGAAHAVGSDFHAIMAARRATSSLEGAMSLSVTLTEKAGAWQATIPAGQGEGFVFLTVFDRLRSVDIGRGENTGRKIHYANVVRETTRLGEYTGAARQIDLPGGLKNTPDEGFAVIVQAGYERRPGLILGAAESPRFALSQ